MAQPHPSQRPWISFAHVSEFTSSSIFRQFRFACLAVPYRHQMWLQGGSDRTSERQPQIGDIFPSCRSLLRSHLDPHVTLRQSFPLSRRVSVALPRLFPSCLLWQEGNKHPNIWRQNPSDRICRTSVAKQSEALRNSRTGTCASAGLASSWAPLHFALNVCRRSRESMKDAS